MGTIQTDRGAITTRSSGETSAMFSSGQISQSEADQLWALNVAELDAQAAASAGSTTTSSTTDTSGATAGQVTTDTQKKIDALVARWNAGEFGSDTNLLLDAIAKSLGVDQATILQPGSGGTSIWDQIQGQFTGQPGATGSTGDPAQVPIAPVIPTESLSRQAIFDVQNLTDQQRRLRAAFGNLTPVAGRAANSILSRFFQQQPITNPLEKTPLNQAFQNFGASRPTPGNLTQGLEDIVAGGAGGGAFLNRFTNAQGDPLAQTAFNASLQPSLAGLNPRVSNKLGSILRDRFADQLVSQPEQFATDEQVLNLLTAFQGF